VETSRVRIEDFGWRAIAKAVFGAAALLLVVAIVTSLADLLRTIVIATFLAIAADAMARWLQQRGLSRGMSIAAVIIGALVALAAALAIIVPPLVTQGGELVDSAPEISHRIEHSALWEHFSGSLNLGDKAVELSQKIAVKVPNRLADTLGAALGGVFGLINLFMAVVFLLAGGQHVLRLLVQLFPKLGSSLGWEVVMGAYTNIGRYVVGATAQALLAGVCLAIFLWIVGVPYALALGLFMLLMDYIPLVGATLGSVPAVAVAFFASGTTDAIVVAVFLLIYQQIENVVIQPRIQGRIVNLPAVAIFFSVMIGGTLMGVVGALFAVPVASIVAIIVRQYLQYTGRTDIELPNVFDESGRPIETAPLPAE
jgi:predicted PurR-regulated permease PerM